MTSTIETSSVQPAPAPAPVARRGRVQALRRLAESSGSFAAFLVLFGTYAVWLGGDFVNAEARLIDWHQATAMSLLGLAALVTLVAGQFDLSIAGMASVSAFLAIGLTTRQEWSFFTVLAFCLALGLVGGLLNGIIVVKFRVTAFIATLATGGIFVGISDVYSNATTVAPLADGPQMPEWFSGPGSLGDFRTKPPEMLIWLVVGVALALVVFTAYQRVRRGGMSAGRLVALGVAVAAAVTVLALGREWVTTVSVMSLVLIGITTLLWVMMQFTTFGRHLRATGSNSAAARLAGVRTEGVTIASFALGGFIASLAGFTMASTQGSAAPGNAQSLLLIAFASAFLSTVLLSRGAFTVWGTVTGAVFLVWISSGLVVGGVPFTWSGLINGIVLALAVAVSSILRKNS